MAMRLEVERVAKDWKLTGFFRFSCPHLRRGKCTSAGAASPSRDGISSDCDGQGRRSNGQDHLAATRRALMFRQNVLSSYRVAAQLLHRTGYIREYCICVGANQPDGSDHKYQNNSEHHRIFSDVLPVFVCPK